MEQETKVCKCCGHEYPLNNFKKGRWGYTSICLACENKHRSENHQKKLEDARQSILDRRAEARLLNLQDFSPRELMEELARRGYEGRLTYTRVEEIDITNF